MALIVTNDFPPAHGGIQRTMSLLAQALVTRGERVVVVAPKSIGCEAYDANAPYNVIRYPRFARVPDVLAMTVCVLWARLTSKDSLTIASMWYPGGLAASIVGRLLGGRLAVLAHGTEIAPSRGGARRRLMRWVFARANVIAVNSNFTRELLLRAGVSGSISVVYPGIDPVPIEPARSPVPTILSVGRLIARKGFDTMIAALPAIVEKIPAVRYEIIGAGPQRVELEALAERLGIRDHVNFLGSVSDAEMRAAYARGWIFALPVRAIGDDVEGFGLVYLEAALAELPSIGGRHSGAEDAIEANETGLLVDGTSIADVAAAAIALLDDPERAARMGIRGRDRVLRDFSLERSATNLAGIVYTAASSAKPQASRASG